MFRFMCWILTWVIMRLRALTIYLLIDINILNNFHIDNFIASIHSPVRIGMMSKHQPNSRLAKSVKLVSPELSEQVRYRLNYLMRHFNYIID